MLNLGTYVVMDFRDLSVESDLAAITNDLFAFLSSIPYQMQECRLVVGIDTNFPIQDEFYEYGRQYVDYWNTVTVSLILGIIGIVIVLVLVSYLTVTTGKIDLNSRIYAKDFDRIPVEAIVLMIAGEIALIGYSMMRLLNTLYLNAVLVGSYSVLIIFANMIGLSAYLSLVRRVRTRNVWKRSVILRLTAGIRKCILNRKITVRIVLYYLSLLILNIGCCFFLNQLEWIVLIAFDLGFLYFLLREGVQRSQINEGIEQLKNGDIHYQFDLEKFHGSNRDMAENLNLIGSGIQKTVAENLKSERLKTDLITNVSHDIKTPLTSIINYIDLLKRQNVQDEKAVEYLKILENKSQRLKHLTEDLLEASKISSGNIKLEYMKLNFKELLLQTNGEFSEKFETKGLELVVRVPDGPVFIWADGRRIWRIVENLYNNVFKYAMPNTRVYVDIKVENERMEFSIKNISEQALNIEASELTERFIRGDISRSTEGSGLGLSIAKNLTELQNGEFSIYLDGDLFKVTVVFPLAKQENRAPGIALMEDDSEPETADFEESPEKQEEEPKKESILTRLGRKRPAPQWRSKRKKQKNRTKIRHKSGQNHTEQSALQAFPADFREISAGQTAFFDPKEKKRRYTGRKRQGEDPNKSKIKLTMRKKMYIIKQYRNLRLVLSCQKQVGSFFRLEARQKERRFYEGGTPCTTKYLQT